MYSTPPDNTLKPSRHYLPATISFSSWDDLEPFFAELANREITSAAALEQWLRDGSELDAVFNEELGWRYIRMTCDTASNEANDAYDFFVAELEPRSAPYLNLFHKKLIDSPYLSQLDAEKYRIMLRGIRRSVEIYREENIPLFTEIDRERQQFARIDADMTIVMEGKELTLQQASNYMKDPNRDLRREAYEKTWHRRWQDRDTLDDLYDRLCAMRHQVAMNAGFVNYRDYSFAAMGRFDYTPEDCFAFHEAVATGIRPIVEEMDRRRLAQLGYDTLRPWDMETDPLGRPALKPFEHADELVAKTIACLQHVRPAYADDIAVMRDMHRFDLDSRKGKAPGGYNYPLNESGVPFIFMNAAGSQRDVVTMVHEAGHAIHSFVSRDLELNEFKNPPSEVCELASMSMELISMEHWEAFYSDAQELKRARQEQLEKILRTLLWVASVDKFQHWVYEHHGHTKEERYAAWNQILSELDSHVTDWSGLDDVRSIRWQRQLHIFEMPFYYIEYGFAQLGAVAIWRNYKTNPAKALDQYEAALRLGYTKSIGEIYEAAGIRFDFSPNYVVDLMKFVHDELAALD